jgi:hypothetical protein
MAVTTGRVTLHQGSQVQGGQDGGVAGMLLFGRIYLQQIHYLLGGALSDSGMEDSSHSISAPTFYYQVHKKPASGGG